MASIKDFTFYTPITSFAQSHDADRRPYSHILTSKKITIDLSAHGLIVTIFPNKKCYAMLNDDGSYEVQQTNSGGANFKWTISEQELCQYFKPDTRYK